MSNVLSPSSPQLNATVMASAGTGKTYLLVTRLVRLLLAGARPDAILAITFTRKAAAEMQSRLAERLLTLASLDEKALAGRLREMDVEPDAATLDRAWHLYESLLQSRQSVRTTTFHAFCQEILLRFPLEADVPPGFDLIDSGAEIAESAWAALLAEAGEATESPWATSLERLLNYCGGLFNLQRAVDSFLAHRGDWWAYTETAKQPVAYALEQLQQQLQVEPDGNPLHDFFTVQRLQELAEFTALLAKHPNTKNNEALEALATARHPELPLTLRFEACRAAFLTKQNTPRARRSSKAQIKSMGMEGEERFLELHETLSQKLLTLLDQLAAQETYRASADWYAVGDRLLHHYQRIKAEQRLLDFTDLEWRAYRLLSHSDNALWVQYKLDQRIDHLLVDEFQDTNPTQWRLLLPLLQEMAASQGDKARSVFLVGDAKQSIYRFRRAEPRLFHTAHDWLSEHLGAQGFPLHISWRSAPAIMHGVNQVFGEHGPLAGQLRDFTEHDTHHQELWGAITVLPLLEEQAADDEDKERNRSLRNPLKEPREVALDERYGGEGRQMAAIIRQLIDEQTVIGSAAGARPIHYGDIMLLVRSRSHVGYYEQALREAGIPYLGAERGTLLESLEVGDMVALLELLITPYNNISLATVLRSPLYACSDTDLQLLAQSGTGTWYQRLQALAATLPPDVPLARAAVQLEQWRALAGRLPIHDLLDRIFCEGNVLEHYQAAFPEHLRSRAAANLVRFLELALEIDSGRYPSLSRFLYRLGELRENRDEAPDEAPVSGSSERVRIMTIHAAKGLEAPVVFLADSAAASGGDKPFRAHIGWPASEPRPQQFLLVGKQGQQPPLVKASLEHEKNEEQREAANLLYVAITRARQLLYVSGVKPRRGDELGWYGALRQALDPLQQTAMDEAVAISSNTMPKSTLSRDKSTQPDTMAEIPATLSTPLTIPVPSYEIAPSRQTEGAAPAGGNVDEDGRQRGLVIHRLLERFTGEPAGNRQQQVAEVAAEFALSPTSESYRAWVAECEALLETAELTPIFSPGDGVESLNEVPIIYPHNGITVHGIIDRLLVQADEVWIVDYKSHQQAAPDDIPPLAANYAGQLGYYAKGVQRLWPEHRVRSFLLFTLPRLLHEVDLSESSVLST